MSDESTEQRRPDGDFLITFNDINKNQGTFAWSSAVFSLKNHHWKLQLTLDHAEFLYCRMKYINDDELIASFRLL